MPGQRYQGSGSPPTFDAMLKDSVSRRFDVLMGPSMDRLGRSVLDVANAFGSVQD
jgi:DNA invertase Pin-like site-specific DNA recombinase